MDHIHANPVTRRLRIMVANRIYIQWLPGACCMKQRSNCQGDGRSCKMANILDVHYEFASLRLSQVAEKTTYSQFGSDSCNRQYIFVHVHAMLSMLCYANAKPSGNIEKINDVYQLLQNFTLWHITKTMTTYVHIKRRDCDLVPPIWLHANILESPALVAFCGPPITQDPDKSK